MSDNEGGTLASTNSKEHSFQVTCDDDGLRLDLYLAAQCAVARNQVKGWIERGVVKVNGTVVSRSRKVHVGDAIQVLQSRLAELTDAPLTGEDWPDSIKVLDETEHYIVLDKPANLVVHPGAGRTHGTLAHFLVGRWPEVAHLGHEQRPGIIHRLDVGTTGVMMVGRSELGYQSLSVGFAERKIRKVYLAMVYGDVAESLDIDLPIGRHPSDRKRMTIRRNGRPARSTVHPIATTKERDISLVAVRLHTGRTHQIRVHLKAANHPLIGDPTYGEARWKAAAQPLRKPLSAFSRPALHAWHLEFNDPATSALQSYEAAPAADFAGLWAELTHDQPCPGLDELLAGHR